MPASPHTGFQTNNASRVWSRRLLRLWVAIFIAALALHILTLRSFPLIRAVDEPGLLAMAYVYPQTHRIETPIFWGQVLTHPREPRAYLLMIGWLQLLGVNWVTGRILFLFVALGALAAIYALGRRLYGKVGGLYAAAFASLMLIFFMTGHQIRLDIAFALAVTLVLLVYGEADRRNDPRWHFLVGFLLIFSYEAHANALVLIFAFGVYYLLRYGLNMLRRRSFAPWAVILGGIVGVGVFALIHIAPSLDDFRQSFNFTLGERGIPIMDMLSGRFEGSLGDTFLAGLGMYWQDAPFEVILSILLLVGGAIHPKTRWLAALYALMTVGGILLLGVYRPVYFVNSAPLIALIAAGLLATPQAWIPALAQRGLATLVLAALAVSTLAQVVPTALEDCNNQIVAQNEQLQAEIPPGATVITSPLALFGLGFDRNVLDIGLAIGLASRSSWDEVLRQTQPDYVVYYVDEKPRTHSAEYGGPGITAALPVEALETGRTRLEGITSTIEVVRLAPVP